MFWQKWFRTQRMERIDLKQSKIVLWDEFDLAEGMKPKMGYLYALSRKPPPDKAAKKTIVTPKGLVSPGKKGTA
jgi:hypothetical protein